MAVHLPSSHAAPHWDCTHAGWLQDTFFLAQKLLRRGVLPFFLKPPHVHDSLPTYHMLHWQGPPFPQFLFCFCEDRRLSNALCWFFLSSLWIKEDSFLPIKGSFCTPSGVCFCGKQASLSGLSLFVMLVGPHHGIQGTVLKMCKMWNKDDS